MHHRHFPSLVLCTVVTLLGSVSSAQTVAIPFFGVHRGGAAWRPEHTIDTYREVIATWPNAMLECDARLTKDGVVVLNHDETVDRTTDGTGPIAELTLAEVKALDAGYDFSPDGGKTFPYRGQGLRIATLDELLAAFPKAPILIEPKDQPGIVGAVAAIVRKHTAEHRVLVASFQSETMVEAKQALPQANTCFSMETGARLLSAMGDTSWNDYIPEDDVLALGIGMLPEYNLSKDEIARIRAKGIAVQLYDVDTVETMQAALELGVDGVLTDRPDLLADVLARRQPMPPATR